LIYACDVKSSNILQVQNALLLSLLSVLDYRIIILIFVKYVKSIHVADLLLRWHRITCCFQREYFYTSAAILRH